jgi:hypothetical protein
MISPLYFFRAQYSLDYTTLHIGDRIVNYVPVSDLFGEPVTCNTEFQVLKISYKKSKVLLREVGEDRLVIMDFATISKAFCLPGVEKYLQMKE